MSLSLASPTISRAIAAPSATSKATLKRARFPKASHDSQVSDPLAVIAFVDIVGSCEISNHATLSEYRCLLEELESVSEQAKHHAFPTVGARQNPFYVKRRGDEVFCLASSGRAMEDIKRVVSFVTILEIQWATSRCNTLRLQNGATPYELGCGIHLGPVSLAEIPRKEADPPVSSAEGFSINMAKRVEGLSRRGSSSKVFVTDSVLSTVREGRWRPLVFSDLQRLDMKGFINPPQVAELSFLDIRQLCLAWAPLSQRAKSMLADQDLAMRVAGAATLNQGAFWLQVLLVLMLARLDTDDQRFASLFNKLWLHCQGAPDDESRKRWLDSLVGLSVLASIELRKKKPDLANIYLKQGYDVCVRHETSPAVYQQTMDHWLRERLCQARRKAFSYDQILDVLEKERSHLVESLRFWESQTLALAGAGANHDEVLTACLEACRRHPSLRFLLFRAHELKRHKTRLVRAGVLEDDCVRSGNPASEHKN